MLEDYDYALSNVKHLHQMAGSVRNQAVGIYATLAHELKYRLSEAEYVLKRILELHGAGALRETKDLPVFGESLAVRFTNLIEKLASIDQEPIRW